ncbi:hypothetical protein AB1N83_010890 [Pleurotus pulmonarius]
MMSDAGRREPRFSNQNNVLTRNQLYETSTSDDVSNVPRASRRRSQYHSYDQTLAPHTQYMNDVASYVPGDRWCARGWTLQEVLAANRIVCFTSNWDRVQAEHLPGSKFHACREIDSDSTVYKQLKETVGQANWMTFHEYRNDVFPSCDRSISFSSDGVMRIMVYLCKPCAPAPPSHVFAVIAQDPWSRGYTGIILEELPEKLYRRIGYKDYWYHEIKVERAPEWIYVK